MKRQKSFIFIFLGILLLFTIILVIALGYYELQKDTLEKIDINIEATGSTDLIVYGSGTVNMNVDGYDMFGTDEDKIVYQTNTGFVFVTTNNLGESLETCTYDMFWVWDEDSDAFTSLKDSSNNTINNELTLIAPFASIDSGITVIDAASNEIKIPDYDASSLSTKLGSGSVSSAKLSYDPFVVNVIYRSFANIDQSSRLGKSYHGKLTIDNINCASGSSTYSGDKTITVTDFTNATGSVVSNPNNYTTLNDTIKIIDGVGTTEYPYVVGTK